MWFAKRQETTKSVDNIRWKDSIPQFNTQKCLQASVNVITDLAVLTIFGSEKNEFLGDSRISLYYFREHLTIEDSKNIYKSFIEYVVYEI